MKDTEKVLIGIVTQQFQPVTAQDVIDHSQEVGYELQPEDVIYVLENMQRRDLLSVIWESRKNKRVKAYGMAKPMFKKCPEIAHLKDMLPTLIKNKEAKAFLKQLEGESSDTTKKRELKYKDYKIVNVEYETISSFVGGSLNKPKSIAKEIQSGVEKIEKKIEASRKKNKESEGITLSYIDRDPEGNPILRANSLRQYFLKNMRIAGLGDAAVNQIYISDAKIEPDGHKYGLEQWPIIIQGQGRGVKTAESLPAGIKIKFKFSFPFEGTKITTHEKLKQILEYQAENGCGFGSYTKKYGKCKLVDFRVDKLPWE